jgi:hypothetical protein
MAALPISWCPSYSETFTACFVMSLIQFSTACKFQCSLHILTTPHFLFYNALYLLLVLQYLFYSSTLPASFTMPLTQFNTPWQFLKCPSFRLTLHATCAMSLIQFNSPCKFCNVPYSIQHFLPASRSFLYCLKASMPIHTLALLAVFRLIL